MSARLMIFLLAILASTGPVHAKYNGRLVPGDWMEPWTAVLEESLNASRLLEHEESQIENLCSGYKKEPAKRKIFWYQLFISLSWKESMHGPENWIEFNGGRNDGLYQINPVLRGAYGCTDFVLFDPLQNIRCAVKMAEKLTLRFESFLKGSKGGMAAYWQPLRATSNLNRKNRAYILRHVKEACQSDTIAYHSPSTRGLMEVDRTFNTLDLEALGLSTTDLEPVIPGLPF